ncbi:MAG TPA: hypothetical protein VGV38_21015 [Pyrinomonadaceae bacterium]|nr:hypothetical protein [Pyrinomonadaceae bacterium]
MDGTWNLEVNTPFGKYPATLVLETVGGSLTGHVRSQIGVTALSRIKSGPDGFEAHASHDFRGTTYTASVAGRAEGDQLEGTIKVDFPLAPTVRFTGTRATQGV